MKLEHKLLQSNNMCILLNFIYSTFREVCRGVKIVSHVGVEINI
jgi:hypothetical protein